MAEFLIGQQFEEISSSPWSRRTSPTCSWAPEQRGKFEATVKLRDEVGRPLLDDSATVSQRALVFWGRWKSTVPLLAANFTCPTDCLPYSAVLELVCCDHEYISLAIWTRSRRYKRSCEHSYRSMQDGGCVYFDAVSPWISYSRTFSLVSIWTQVWDGQFIRQQIVNFPNRHRFS